MSLLQLDTEVTTDPLVEYTTNNPRFSAGWQQFAQTLLVQLSGCPDKNLTHRDLATQHQVDGMARAAHARFDKKELALYLQLRTTTAQVPLSAEETAAEPRKLTDQRLMIEICLLTGDCQNAVTLIEFYPSVRAA